MTPGIDIATQINTGLLVYLPRIWIGARGHRRTLDRRWWRLHRPWVLHHPRRWTIGWAPGSSWWRLRGWCDIRAHAGLGHELSV
jgi:hypothetical protein